MAGKDVSYQFLDALAKSVGMAALAKSVGMDAETVKQALVEINQLQTQTQALEPAVHGKAPTNHASQQTIFGTANEQMYGHVKIAHEVTNDSTDGVAVSPDAVYAYADPAGHCIPYNKFPPRGYSLLIDNKISGVTVAAYAGSACLYVEIFGTPETTVPSDTVIADLNNGTFWNFYSSPINALYFDNAKFAYRNNTIQTNRVASSGVYIASSFVIPLIVKE